MHMKQKHPWLLKKYNMKPWLKQFTQNIIGGYPQISQTLF